MEIDLFLVCKCCELLDLGENLVSDAVFFDDVVGEKLDGRKW